MSGPVGHSSLSDFKVLQKLGKGAYGTVFKVLRKADNRLYVLKTIEVATLGPDEQTQALNEVRILASLDHPNITKYYDSFIHEDSLCIIMELATGGTLHTALQHLDGKRLPEDKVWRYFIQLLGGIHHMHSKRVLHRDLKSLNIFLDGEDNIKIGDFGVAKLLGSMNAFAQTMVGTPYYLSPELCENKPYNEKSDVWALGVILYELCTLRQPFDAGNQSALILKIIRGRYPAVPKVYSVGLRRVVVACLTRDPTRRPDVKALLERDVVQTKCAELGLGLPRGILQVAKPPARPKHTPGSKLPNEPKLKEHEMDAGRRARDHGVGLSRAGSAAGSGPAPRRVARPRLRPPKPGVSQPARCAPSSAQPAKGHGTDEEPGQVPDAATQSSACHPPRKPDRGQNRAEGRSDCGNVCTAGESNQGHRISALPTNPDRAAGAPRDHPRVRPRSRVSSAGIAPASAMSGHRISGPPGRRPTHRHPVVRIVRRAPPPLEEEPSSPGTRERARLAQEVAELNGLSVRSDSSEDGSAEAHFGGPQRESGESPSRGGPLPGLASEHQTGPSEIGSRGGAAPSAVSPQEASAQGQIRTSARPMSRTELWAGVPASVRDSIQDKGILPQAAGVPSSFAGAQSSGGSDNGASATEGGGPLVENAVPMERNEDPVFAKGTGGLAFSSAAPPRERPATAGASKRTLPTMGPQDVGAEAGSPSGDATASAESGSPRPDAEGFPVHYAEPDGRHGSRKSNLHDLAIPEPTHKAAHENSSLEHAGSGDQRNVSAGNELAGPEERPPSKPFLAQGVFGIGAEGPPDRIPEVMALHIAGHGGKSDEDEEEEEEDEASREEEEDNCVGSGDSEYLEEEGEDIGEETDKETDDKAELWPPETAVVGEAGVPADGTQPLEPVRWRVTDGSATAESEARPTELRTTGSQSSGGLSIGRGGDADAADLETFAGSEAGRSDHAPGETGSTAAHVESRTGIRKMNRLLDRSAELQVALGDARRDGEGLVGKPLFAELHEFVQVRPFSRVMGSATSCQMYVRFRSHVQRKLNEPGRSDDELGLEIQQYVYGRIPFEKAEVVSKVHHVMYLETEIGDVEDEIRAMLTVQEAQP